MYAGSTSEKNTTRQHSTVPTPFHWDDDDDACWLTNLELLAVQPACLRSHPNTPLSHQQLRPQQQHPPLHGQQELRHELLLHLQIQLTRGQPNALQERTAAEPSLPEQQHTMADSAGRPTPPLPLLLPDAQLELLMLGRQMQVIQQQRINLLQLLLCQQQQQAQRLLPTAELMEAPAKISPTATAEATAEAATEEADTAEVVTVGPGISNVGARSSSSSSCSDKKKYGSSAWCVCVDVEMNIPCHASNHLLDCLHLLLVISSTGKQVAVPESAAEQGPLQSQATPTMGIVSLVPLLVMPAPAQQEVQQLLLPAMRQEVQADQQHQQGCMALAGQAMQVDSTVWQHYNQLANDIYIIMQLSEEAQSEAVTAAAAAAAAAATAPTAVVQLSVEAQSETATAAAAAAATAPAAVVQLSVEAQSETATAAAAAAATAPAAVVQLSVEAQSEAAVAVQAGTENAPGSNAGALPTVVLMPAAVTPAAAAAAAAAAAVALTPAEALAHLTDMLLFPLLFPFLAAQGLHNTLQLLLGCLPLQLQQQWQQQQLVRLQELTDNMPAAMQYTSMVPVSGEQQQQQQQQQQQPVAERQQGAAVSVEGAVESLPTALAAPLSAVEQTFIQQEAPSSATPAAATATAAAAAAAGDEGKNETRSKPLSKGHLGTSSAGAAVEGFQHSKAKVSKGTAAAAAASDGKASKQQTSSAAAAAALASALAAGTPATAAAAAAAAAAAVPWYLPLTQFGDAGVEQRYLAWKHRSLLHLDHMAVVFCAMYLAALLRRMLSEPVTVFYFIYILVKTLPHVPLALGLRDTYMRYRELWLFLVAPTTILAICCIAYNNILQGTPAMLLPNRAYKAFWNSRAELATSIIRPFMQHMRLRPYIVYTLLDACISVWAFAQVFDAWAAAERWAVASVLSIGLCWGLDLHMRRRFFGEQLRAGTLG